MEEEDEGAEIAMSIQNSDDNNTAQTSQVITTNDDGEYFINTIEITEDELNEQIQLENQDYDDGTNDIQGYTTSEGNYQEVIIINAEDLKVESPTHSSSSLDHSSSSLQGFLHVNNDTSTTTIKQNNNILNHNISKNKFILPNPNFSPATHQQEQQQQHSTNFIFTTLEGKTFQFSPSNFISNLNTGQQQEQIINPINQLSKHNNLISYTIHEQQSSKPDDDHYDQHKINQEKVADEKDLSVQMKSKSVLCNPGAKSKLNKNNKKNLNNKQQAKYQEIPSTSTTKITHTVSPCTIGKKMLRNVNDNNRILNLETDKGKIDDEIDYQIEDEEEEEEEEGEEETIVDQINQSTNNTENIMISTVDPLITTTTSTTAASTTPVLHKIPNSVFEMSKMTDNSTTASTSNTVKVSFPGLPGVVCQLQRFMYTRGLCRICLLVKPDVVSIFEDVNIKSNGQIENSRGPHASHRYNIIPAIKTLLDIEVKYGDGLSDQICSECMDNLMAFSVFRKKIEIGHSKLNAILAQVKGTSTPTVIPELGERDMKKTDIYRHVDAIVKARELMDNSIYKARVSRSLSDRILEKIFQTLSVVVGVKSGKLKDLEHYVLNEPFVKCWFCYSCNQSILGGKEAFSQHNIDVHHIKSETDVLYPCDLCNQSFSLVDSTEPYSEHWIKHFYIYECTECDKKMPSQKGLWAHKRNAHSILNKTFQCDHQNCDKTFSKKAHLNAHQKIHDLNPEGRKFKRKEILVGHRENVHLNLKKFTCEHKGCTKRFYTAQSLKTHRIKHGEESFCCPVCNKNIRTRSNYFKHLKIHERSNEDVVNKETVITPIQVCILPNDLIS